MKPTLSYEDIEYYLESIPGVVVIDMDGIIRYVNHQCAWYFDMKMEDILNRPILEVFPPTKMMENLYRKEAGIEFYSTHLGIGISIQIPLFREGRRVGLLEYDVTQGSNSLYDLSRGYSDFLDQELLMVEEELVMIENVKYTIGSILGESEPIIQLKQEIIAAAKTNSTVVIRGETGTGKELVAHAIHNLSDRRKSRMVKVNASAFPENLVESELFGYEEGSFTGAIKGGRKGKFELADGGTLFIDEICQMPLSVQPKLLRVLQEREVDRIGGEESIAVDVRVIVATNQDLFQLAKIGKFRMDLYYRLSVLEIEIPPLRKRKQDIDDLVTSKINELNEHMGMKVEGIDNKALEVLKSYDWPGNVRELYNVVERAMTFSSSTQLTEKEIYRAMLKTSGEVNIKVHANDDTNTGNVIQLVRNEAEKDLITSVLKRFHNNKTKTAEYLNIARPLLYQKMKRLGIKT